ncbi:site-2 protease family protein [Acetobacterium paludosum]|uniref:Site-2 protease family protein n=1 Tax=Acetobacterium paludosum TaxID=52693 RepID=A0A923HSF4_9FIRM|nr:site-2 protease family protein [Acetobacterium paludosum]MBC3886952.1 site-2 protease family protein [Acetobacterium paludosum]
MFNFSADYFYSLLLSLPGILIAISFHEMAHAYAADTMGDPTPKNAGRLTINPLKHIDPLGFISMLLFRFGWAKPVPVNPNNFKDRKKGMIAVALSGVLTNLLLAFLGMAAYLAVIPLNNEILMTILQYIYIYNIVFAVFNIIPIPPLDGSQILVLFLPPKALMTYYKYQRYGMIVIFALAITGLLGIIINPAINGIVSLFSAILLPIFNLFWS